MRFECRTCGGIGEVGAGMDRRSCLQCHGRGYLHEISTPAALLFEIRHLHQEVGAILGNSTDRSRNRKAIELHTRMRRASDAMDALRPKYPHHVDLQSARRILHEATEAILREVFMIDPDTINKNKEGPVATRTPKLLASVPHLTAGEQFVNDDYASVSFNLNGTTFEGHAKRDPQDKPNRDVGITLATGRALRKAGNALIKEANDTVREADKTQRQEQAAKAQVRAKQQKQERQAAAQSAALQRRVDLVSTLASQVTDLTVTAEDQAATIAEQAAQIAEFQRLDKQRKARAAKKRVSTRKATAGAK